MATVGYVTVSKTKESGALPQDIPAGVWTPVDLGLQTLTTKVNIINAQLYFEGIPSGTWKMSIRTQRGSGDDTGQDDFLVRGPVWARSYPDIDYVQKNATDDARRGIEVWSEKPCQLWTRIIKAARPVLTDGGIA